MTDLLDGKKSAAAIREETAEAAGRLRASGVVPTLALVLTALFSLALGGLVGWLVARARTDDAVATLRADQVRLTAELAHRERVIPEKLALLEAMQQQVRDSFEALAATRKRSSEPAGRCSRSGCCSTGSPASAACSPDWH